MPNLGRFPRRALVGGAGVMLSLPFLDLFWERRARAADPLPQRLLCFYVPNGMHMASWTPTTTGTDYELPLILEPLEPHREDMLVLTGLDNAPADPEGHAAGTAAFLTCREVNKSESEIVNGISMDQIYALGPGGTGKLPSIALGVEVEGTCSTGFSCVYNRNVSWSGPQTPMPKITDPQVAFDLLFAGYDPNATSAEIEQRRARRLSVLDAVREETDALSVRLGARDRLKVDEYMTSVRELEKRITEAPEGPWCDADGFVAQYETFPEHVDVMIDLMVLAMRCDATRVLTFMLNNSATDFSFDFLGVPGSHHEISHHGGFETNFAMLETIDRWEVTQLAALLERMKAIPEGEGTLLDNTMVYFSSEIEDGDSHSHLNLPIVLAGRAGGAITPGRHLVYDHDPVANLFIAMLQILGVDIGSFGDDGTGPLTGLA